MKFSRSLIKAVQEDAPNGVEFEDHEVIVALRKAVEGDLAVSLGLGTAVEKAARRQYLKLNPRTTPGEAPK